MASAFADNPVRHAALLGAALALSACSSDRRTPELEDGSAKPLPMEAAAGDAHDATHTPGHPEAAAPVDVTPAPEGEPYETLSEWHLFRDAVRQSPADGVVPYD